MTIGSVKIVDRATAVEATKRMDEDEALDNGVPPWTPTT